MRCPRKTIYKWVERYREQGPGGLIDHSRRPQRSPPPGERGGGASYCGGAPALEVGGPGKLRVKLCQGEPERHWPAVSTNAAVLQAKGPGGEPSPPSAHAACSVRRMPIRSGPNDVWCADFKGWFRTGDGTRVDPLTITDACSRYLLRCQIVARTNHEFARAVFETAFREFGLPAVIHTDNGVPFASVAPGGLSALSMWFVKLGIVPERSRPGLAAGQRTA